jgi:hypothetical protein
VTIVNNSRGTKYSTLAHRDILPGTQSADVDAAGLTTALKAVVESCGGIFSIRLNDTERELVHKLLDLDGRGRGTRLVARPRPHNPMEALMRREAEEKARKMASIASARSSEKAIMDEVNYTSRKDMDDARAKSMSLKGNVEAKKLNTKMGEEVSLNDLMGDNKFIEESMKHSSISTAMASEDGWDMEKMNAPKVKDSANAAPSASAAEENKAKPEAGETAATTKKTRKSSRRRKENE